MSEQEQKNEIPVKEKAIPKEGVVVEEVKPTKKRTKPKTCPLKHSNWFLTVNTNKNTISLQKDELDKLVNDFKNTVREFYNDKLAKLEFFVLEGSKQGEGFGMVRNEERDELKKRITDIKAKFVIEVGPSSHMLHSHGMIAVSKRGLDTKINYSTIKEWFNEKLGYPVHFNAKLYNDAQKSLEAYIEKNPFN